MLRRRSPRSSILLKTWRSLSPTDATQTKPTKLQVLYSMSGLLIRYFRSWLVSSPYGSVCIMIILITVLQIEHHARDSADHSCWSGQGKESCVFEAASFWFTSCVWWNKGWSLMSLFSRFQECSCSCSPIKDKLWLLTTIFFCVYIWII